MNTQIITLDGNKQKASDKLASGKINFNYSDICGLSEPIEFQKLKSNKAKFDKMVKAKVLGASMPDLDSIKKYGSALDIPVLCYSIKDSKQQPTKMSVREMVHAGVYDEKKIKASSNTVLTDWETLWDAMRIDLTIKKIVHSTIRENIYNIISNPDADRTIKTQEMFPYSIIFKEYNGNGEAVNQGETRGGQADTLEHIIYAAGFSVDLIAKLYDRALDFDKVNEAVIDGYNSLRDDLAMSPILSAIYAAGKTTSAYIGDGTKEEKLYYTLDNAVDAFAKKIDPVTKQKIGANNLVLLCSEYDAMHVGKVINGNVKKSSVNTDAGFNSISQIKKVIGYDGNTIQGRMDSTTYSGVTEGEGYLIMPATGATKNRYMNISEKRTLQMEVDMQPDVKTLTQEERAYYFAEGIMFADGIEYFIQKVLFPTW